MYIFIIKNSKGGEGVVYNVDQLLSIYILIIVT